MAAVEFQRARSPEQQELRRAAILAIARDMLDQVPPSEVSLRELSRRVGLSKSNVVRYFPTREAVFLAVLSADWDAWLSALATSLPNSDARRRAQTRDHLVAAAIAQSLSTRRRFCDLVAACPTVLEHNVPHETARGFKVIALANLTRFAGMIRSVVPELGDPQSFEFAGIVWAFVAGAWPMANPSPVIATVLADPDLAALSVDFRSATTRTLTVVLDGLTRPR